MNGLEYLHTGVFYVQKGEEGFRVRSIEVPVLYKRRIGENTHLLVGPAPSYDGDRLDVGATIGLAVRAEDRAIGMEVAFVYGPVPYRYHTGDSEPGHRVLRIPRAARGSTSCRVGSASVAEKGNGC